MLEYRNTPLEGVGLSPAQLLSEYPVSWKKSKRNTNCILTDKLRHCHTCRQEKMSGCKKEGPGSQQWSCTNMNNRDLLWFVHQMGDCTEGTEMICGKLMRKPYMSQMHRTPTWTQTQRWNSVTQMVDMQITQVQLSTLSLWTKKRQWMNNLKQSHVEPDLVDKWDCLLDTESRSSKCTSDCVCIVSLFQVWNVWVHFVLVKFVCLIRHVFTGWVNKVNRLSCMLKKCIKKEM